jgi:YfiH family protein
VSSGELSFELGDAGHVLFTDRADGNMSSSRGEDSRRAPLARARLRSRIGARRIARGRQVHGAVVRRVGAPEPAVEADGQATALRGVAVTVLTADCLPVALARSSATAASDPRGAVAMLHAGWRGLAAGVLEAGVRAVDSLGGAGGEVVAVIGPGAGVCCYEVGEEVHAAFSGAHGKGRCIDLRAIARERLLAAGVSEVRTLDACTVCDERFFSHRREGARAGRQAGVAWLG